MDVTKEGLQEAFEKRGQTLVAVAEQRDEAVEALRFARSVIKSGEPWTEQCEQIINSALRKARGDTTP